MADEDHVMEIEGGDDFQHIASIAVEFAIAFRAVGAEVGLSPANVIEKDDAIMLLEGRRHEPPHVLVAAKSVGEEHRLGGMPENSDVVSSTDIRNHRTRV